MTLPSTSTNGEGAGEKLRNTVAGQLSRNHNIFHEWYLWEATYHLEELPGNKKALIAINHFQAFDPLRISSFNPSINTIAIWNCLAKGSVKMFQTLTILADLIKARRCKAAIRVEEQEEISGGD